MSHKSLAACKSSPNLKLGLINAKKSKSSPKLFRNLSNDNLNSPPALNPHKALTDLYRRFSCKKSTSNANPFAFKKKKLKNLEDIYHYCNKENTFTVKIHKSNHLLGLSINGGRDASKRDSFSQLIRIWNLHPSLPALKCGKLALGDVILEVNGTSVLGLTYNEALEVLRNVPAHVELKIFRPNRCCTSPKEKVCIGSNCSSTAAKINVCCAQNTSNDAEACVFEITLMKQDKCLGFSIFHEDNTTNTAGGIHVKSLTREPAISDGRIQPGDRILQVNETDISEFSYSEALVCLRNAPEAVTLKLHRNKEGTSSCRNHPLSKVQTFNVILELSRNESIGFCIWDSIGGSLDATAVALPCAPEVKIVFSGSLADKNGIKLGDRILELNGESFIGKSTHEVNYVLRKTDGVMKMVFCRIQQNNESNFH